MKLLVFNGKIILNNSKIVATDIVSTPQLAAPTNLTADGTTVSWDAVENATSYNVYADDTLLGNTTGTVSISKN